MKINLNGEIYNFAEKITIHDLLEKVQCTYSGFAVAVNRKVVAKSIYNQYWLTDDDKVEIVTAYQGG
ncbi:MAG: sulfur carrier protein ThiS [Burkholderiales bacterium]|nr:sulfur carrier protein ThiS [Burkholderiales bacterium]